MTARPQWQQPFFTAVDKALELADGLADRRVAALRTANPKDSPAELITKLERDFTTAVVAMGAGTGVLAAVPATGAVMAIGAAGVDVVTFLTAAATHALAVARIQGAKVTDIEYQRTLLFGILLGSNGSKVVLNGVGRAGVHWGTVLGETLPIRILREVNEALGGLLLRRFGPRVGLVTAVKFAPLGFGAVIGGVGNYALAKEIVRSTNAAFGEPPTDFPDTAADPVTPTDDTGGTSS
ncbi:hypothetical protein ACQBAU_06540 [Propionibacteriaceae bacterium Y2011]|uniref:hypothetical protein n=1 Tax=Microlunatus sp. Y2014 TaxID=3418488 RepID=UPI003B4D8B61